MKIKTLHLSFGGSLHWHRPTATTSRYSHGNEKRGEKQGQKGQQTTGVYGASSRRTQGAPSLWQNHLPFLTLGPCWQCRGGNESLALLARSGSRNGRQEKGQRHVPWGLFLPGNASVFLCVTQTKTSPRMTCTIGSHAQNRAQRLHFRESEAASG